MKKITWHIETDDGEILPEAISSVASLPSVVSHGDTFNLPPVGEPGWFFLINGVTYRAVALQDEARGDA